MSAQQLHQQARRHQRDGRPAQAEAAYRQALVEAPQDAELYYDLGGLLLAQGRAGEAATCYRQALALAPGHPQLLLQLGNALSAQGHYEAAAECFRTAVHGDPGLMAAHYNLGNALRELGQPQAAAESYRAALRLAPNDADTHNNLGNVLRELGQLDQAIVCYREALRLNPKLHHARMHLLHQRQHACDWDGMEAEITEIRRIVREVPQAQISPFAFLALPGTTPAEQKRCAQNWTASRYAQLLRDGRRLAYARSRHEASRLRIGYLSADFRQHPLAWLATELVALHDRDGFAVHAYSYGINDGTAERRRWEQAFDQFHDIRALTLHEAAERIHADGIDILVDLTGYTQSSRSGILALRPAPVQASWLGFPGSMGAPFVDYLIADAFITPPGCEADYSERLLRLPDCYQPNDRQRPDAAPPTRAACGLPENAVVLCCFNQSFKITPHVFDIWMEILGEFPSCVLWLLECNRWAMDNLLREAARRGVAASRLVFAPRVPIAQHLARHRCADLFLDTLPYNAHTTTSDALWMGVPVLTCAGDTFASRVAGSLLRAAGLPQLVTESLAAYHAMARALLGEPARLQELRARVEAHARQSPLFDTPRLARQLEAGYRQMWAAYLAGPRTAD